MKKFLSFLTSLSLISSTLTTVVSCNILTEDGIVDCFDEFGNNVTTKGSENYQWSLFFSWSLFMLVLPSEYFPDSASFYRILNNLKDKQEIFKVEYEYTLLITNYECESMNWKVINQMKKDLDEKENGNYVFVNFPSIDLSNIKNELEIDFQFLFLIKKSNEEIVNNNNNNWFFWYDYQISNNLGDEDLPYFFNVQGHVERENRVVTTIQPQTIN